jgi:hypothetical protein
MAYLQRMYASKDNGLAVSAIIYILATMLGAALFVGVPLYLAARPTVVVTPPTQNFAEAIDRKLIRESNHSSFPVARLKHDDIAAAAAGDTDVAVAQKADRNRSRTGAVTHAHETRRRQSTAYAEKTQPWRRATYPNFAPL